MFRWIEKARVQLSELFWGVGKVKHLPKAGELKPSPERDIKFMPFKLDGTEGKVYGGPYTAKPDDVLIGVKMAIEIDAPHWIGVPTKDFSVPDPATLRLGLMAAVLALRKHQEVYVGCMGGIGRTGLFMAGLAKIMWVSNQLPGEFDESKGALPPYIQYVRQTYNIHAVETTKQVKFIKDLPVVDLAYFLTMLD